MEMDFQDSQYFSINKNMMRYMGLWHYQNRVAKIAIRTVFGMLMCVGVLPQVRYSYNSQLFEL